MTPLHGYNTPSKGEQDWHFPLNENFRRIDKDVEVRDVEANLDSYSPAKNAMFRATDTGAIFYGDGSNWVKASINVSRVSADDGIASTEINHIFYPEPARGGRGIQEAFDSGGPNTTVVLRDGVYTIEEPIVLPENPAVVGHANAFNTGAGGTLLEASGNFEFGSGQIGAVLEPKTRPTEDVLATPHLRGFEINGRYNCPHAFAAPCFNGRITNVRFHRTTDVTCWLMGTEAGSTDNNFIGWSVLSHGKNVLEIGRTTTGFTAVGSQYIGYGSFIHTATNSVVVTNGDNINLVNAHLFDLDGDARELHRHRNGDKLTVSLCHIDGNSTDTTGIRLTHGSSPVVGVKILGNNFVDTFNQMIDVVDGGDGFKHLRIGYNSFMSGLSGNAPANSEVGVRFQPGSGSYEGCEMMHNGFHGEFTVAAIEEGGAGIALRNTGASDGMDVRTITNPTDGDRAFHDGSGGNTKGSAEYVDGGWRSLADGSEIE